MVILNRRRWLILTLFACLIVFVLKCQVSEPGWERSNIEISLKQQNYTAEITAEELDEFIKLWPQFKELGFADDLIVSYRIDRPSKFIDWKSKIWFVYHKWDVDVSGYNGIGHSPLHGDYGLYKSANLSGISGNGDGGTDKYVWWTDKKLYDRTAALLFALNVRRDAVALMDMLYDRPEQVAQQMFEVQELRSKVGDEDLNELKLVESREAILKKLFN